MAVIPTGAIYKSLIFDGEDSRNYGVYITGEAVYNAPERDVEMVSIPGRNGSFALDKGRFQNIEVSYPAGIFAETEADFAQAISDFRNLLCSRNGYVRLTDDYNPNEYRMAIYKSGLEVEPAQLKAGEFNIVFDCKPQRWLTSGEEPITIGEWGETETVTGDIVEVENPDGQLGVKSLTVALEPIQDLNGYDKPWSGGNGENLAGKATSLPSSGVTAIVGEDGTITLNGTSTATTFIRGTFDCGDATKTYTWAVFNTVYWANGVEFSIRNADASGAGGWAKINSANKSLTFTPDVGSTPTMWQIQINSGIAFNNVILKPMIVLGSTTPTTYSPYSNICPISGRTEVVTSRCGKNLLNLDRALGTPNPSTGSNTTSPRVMDTEHYYVGLRHDNYYYPSNVAEYSVANNEVTVRGTNNAYGVGFPIEVKPNTQYEVSATVEGSGYLGVSYYDANWGYISYVNGAYTFTTPTNASYAVILLRSLSTSATATWKNVQVELGTTATAYEPYNGNTYTTALGQTVYGGTLDVTTGVLTVTKAMQTFDGTESMQPNGQTANTSRFYVAVNGKANGVANIISDRFSADVTGDVVGRVIGRASSNGIEFYLPVSVPQTVQGGKDWFTANPTQLCYELATPQTYQLSPQEISLLQGTNNVWSDGSITLEYGQLPNVIVNPTLFPASPLIECNGHGDIFIGGVPITVMSVPIGDVLLSNGVSFNKPNIAEYSALAEEARITIDSSKLNTGDNILVKESVVTYNITVEPIVTLSSVSTEDPTGENWTTKCAVSSPTTAYFRTTIPAQNFKKGTASTKTYACWFNWAAESGSITSSNHITMQLEYDGANTITLSVTERDSGVAFAAYSLSGTIGQVNGYSTIIVDNTFYIDLEIGEAYFISNNTYSSANYAVQIPPKLPTLRPGARTITYSNTITNLKITPRWWKI